MTNWHEVLRHRRNVFACLIQARKSAVYAGDRPVVDYLDNAIRRQRERVCYAEKRASWEPRVFTPENARFATPDNRPDNGRPAGSKS